MRLPCITVWIGHKKFAENLAVKRYIWEYNGSFASVETIRYFELFHAAKCAQLSSSHCNNSSRLMRGFSCKLPGHRANTKLQNSIHLRRWLAARMPVAGAGGVCGRGAPIQASRMLAVSHSHTLNYYNYIMHGNSIPSLSTCNHKLCAFEIRHQYLRLM